MFSGLSWIRIIPVPGIHREQWISGVQDCTLGRLSRNLPEDTRVVLELKGKEVISKVL